MGQFPINFTVIIKLGVFTDTYYACHLVATCIGKCVERLHIVSADFCAAMAMGRARTPCAPPLATLSE